MNTVLATWYLILGLLLQSVAWALPDQRAGQVERLAHEVAHAIDHGHHQHEAAEHDVDAVLLLDDARMDGSHGPHHSHASDGVQLQGLPVTVALSALALPCSAHRAWTPVRPPPVDLAGLLRPPQSLV